MKKYYEILGLKPDASENDIKKAYKKLALQYHPDRNKEDPDKAAEKFKEISNAYQILTNKDKQMQGMNMGGSGFIDPNELFAQFFNIGKGMSPRGGSNVNIFNVNSGTNSTFEINIGGNMGMGSMSQQTVQTRIVNGQRIDTITEIKNGVMSKKTVVRQL